jgi:hypothetical protein
VFGGIAGAVGAIWILLEYAFGFHGARISDIRITTAASLVVPVVAIMVGIMRWRDRMLDGSIRFTQAAGVALAIGLVYSIIVAAFSGIYAAFINRDFLSALLAFQAQMMRDAGFSADDIAKQVEAGKHATATSLAYARFVFWLGTSLVVSLISALLVRKRPL